MCAGWKASKACAPSQRSRSSSTTSISGRATIRRSPWTPCSTTSTSAFPSSSCSRGSCSTARMRGDDPPHRMAKPRRYARSRALRILPAYWLALTVVLVFRAPEALPATIPALVVIWWLLFRSWRRGYDSDRFRVRLAKAVASVFVLLVLLLAVVSARGITLRRVVAPHEGLPLPPHQFRRRIADRALVDPVHRGQLLSRPAADRRGPSRVCENGATASTRALAPRRPLAAFIPIGIMWQAVASDEARAWNVLPGYLDQFAVGMLLAVAYEFARGRRLGHVGSARPDRGGRRIVRRSGGGRARRPGCRSLAERRRRVGASTVRSWRPASRWSSPRCSSAATARCSPALVWRPVAWAGLVSYGIFLWHDPLLWSWCDHDVVGGGVPYGVSVLLVVAATAVAAGLSWVLVERRALALKEARTHGRHPAEERRPVADAAPAVAST